MSKWLFALVQFVPLSLFATYAYWHGAPDVTRWENAFKLASLAAIAQLAIVLPQRRPANRLVLAANLYLLLGGLAFLTHQWWFLQLYEALQETAIFILMLAVGVVATLASPAGYIGAHDRPAHLVRRASLWLLLATALALVLAATFSGDSNLAAVYPIIGLAVLQRWLLHRTGRAVASGAYQPAEPHSGLRRPPVSGES